MLRMIPDDSSVAYLCKLDMEMCVGSDICQYSYGVQFPFVQWASAIHTVISVL